MGREVRRVPNGWQHPTTFRQEWNPLARRMTSVVAFKPLHGCSLSQRQAEWDNEKAKWDAGFIRDYSKRDEAAFKPRGAEVTETFEEYHGERPVAEDYRPDWDESEMTHFQMYETVTEGTPISPVFETPEELARWLADNGANADAYDTATYEQWLRVAKGGYAPSIVAMPGKGLQSGVAGLTEE